MEISTVRHTELVPVCGVNTVWWGHLVTVDRPQTERQWQSTAKTVCHIKKLDTTQGTFLV